MIRRLAFMLAIALPLCSAAAQVGPPDYADPAPVTSGSRPPAQAAADASDPFNPASILAGAAKAFPGQSTDSGSSTAAPTTGLSTAMNVVMVLTVISLVPSIMLMMTSFLRIVVVMGLLKQALGTQQMPPSQVMLGLSLILTMLVMAPTMDRINAEAMQPYKNGQIKTYDVLWDKAKQPLRDFMFDQIEATGNYSSVYMILNYRGVDTSKPQSLTRADVDMVSLVPAFVLSELKVAFLMGFRIMLPFLVIDMVISAILIAMNMMMLPPVLISLPFKLLLFVLVDGWTLITGSLLRSFAHGSPHDAVALIPPDLIHAAASLVYDESILDAIRTMLMVTMKIVLPILGAGLVIGLVISILQSVTQIQDQSLVFVPKLIVMVGTVIVLTPWIAARLVDFAAAMFSLQ
jgi:flagellar biosynthetic protein FliP